MAQQHDDSWRGHNGGSAAGANAGTEVAPNLGEKMKQFNGDDRWKSETARHPAPSGRPRERASGPAGGAAAAAAGADRWADEQLFEEDVRAVLSLMRPNRRERMLGWSEYRTGGAHFRATVSWDEEFEVADNGAGKMRVPNMCDVLEAILVGSARHEDDLMPAEEFEIYRDVVRELYRRLDELQSCYE